jgi:hypothetical protein
MLLEGTVRTFSQNVGGFDSMDRDIKMKTEEQLTENGLSPYGEAGVSLDELAGRIRKQHRQYCKSIKSGLEHAIEAGRLLKTARDKLSHGEWLGWIEDNCRFSQRTAENYVRLANHETELKANSQCVADLTLRAALATLARARTSRKTATDRSEGSKSPEAAQPLEEWLNKIEMLLEDVPSECRILALTTPGTDPGVTAFIEQLVSSSEALGYAVLRRNRMLLVRSGEKKSDPAPIIARSDDFAATPMESELPVSEMVESDLSSYSMPIEDA